MDINTGLITKHREHNNHRLNLVPIVPKTEIPLVLKGSNLDNCNDTNTEDSLKWGRVQLLQDILIARSQKVSSFDDQIKIFMDLFQPNPTTTRAKLSAVLSDFNKLKSTFPQMAIRFYGSAQTGLNTKESDIDIFISNCAKSINFWNSLKEIISASDFFLTMPSTLDSNYLKCIHNETQYVCNLSNEDLLSCYNSDLIGYYVSLDAKMNSLIIFFRHWIESCFQQQVSFSKFAIDLMVIFYLQQAPYNLPSVKDLQEGCAPYFIGNWNCAFNPKVKSFQNLQKESFLQLIRGLFGYYARFDFFNYVICPYFGKPIKKVCFIQPFDLPFEYLQQVKEIESVGGHLFELSIGLCLQEPFRPTKNLLSLLPPNLSATFSLLCRKSEEIMFDGESNMIQMLLSLYKHFNRNDYRFEIIKSHDCDAVEWKNTVKTVAIRTLQEVFSCNVYQKQNNSNTVLAFYCVSNYDIWSNRISVCKSLIKLNQFSPGIGEIDVEYAVTSELVTNFRSQSSATFNLQLAFLKDPIKVVVTFRSLTKCDLFIAYFALKLPQFLGDALKKTKLSMIESIDIIEITDSSEHEDENVPSENSLDSFLSGKSDDDDDDIPADFFDDFADETFLAGLDLGVDSQERVKRNSSERKTDSTCQKRVEKNVIELECLPPYGNNVDSNEKKRSTVLLSCDMDLKKPKLDNEDIKPLESELKNNNDIDFYCGKSNEFDKHRFIDDVCKQVFENLKSLKTRSFSDNFLNREKRKRDYFDENYANISTEEAVNRFDDVCEDETDSKTNSNLSNDLITFFDCSSVSASISNSLDKAENKSLSDLVPFTVKPRVTKITGEMIQQQSKSIARAKAVIAAMNPTCFNGKPVTTPSPFSLNAALHKFVSPILKNNAKLSFTAPPDGPQHEDSYKAALDKIIRIGNAPEQRNVLVQANALPNSTLCQHCHKHQRKHYVDVGVQCSSEFTENIDFSPISFSIKTTESFFDKYLKSF